jgi:hypothetical protein
MDVEIHEWGKIQLDPAAAEQRKSGRVRHVAAGYPYSQLKRMLSVEGSLGGSVQSCALCPHHDRVDESEQ